MDQEKKISEENYEKIMMLGDKSIKPHENLIRVYPQKNLEPGEFSDLDFKNFFIQPMDSQELEANVAKSIKFCMDNPKWRLSLQTHKILGIR